MIDVPDSVIIAIVGVGIVLFILVSRIRVIPTVSWDPEVEKLFEASRKMSKQERAELFTKLAEMDYEEIYALMIAKGWKTESARMLAESLTKR